MTVRDAATSFMAVLFSLSSLAALTRADVWIDPEPALTWQDTLACPLVVAAKYESHQGNELVLRVFDVLKGKADPAQLLSVKLEHLYSIETRPVGWESFRKAEDDGIPRLCYKTQIVNPGGLVPIPVRSDARQPAIYFFRETAKPVLRVSGQVQSPFFQKGWQQALDGKPMDLLFRLTQHVDAELAREALEELGKSRDPACLDQLFEWNLNPAPEGSVAVFEPEIWLARLGDHEGDIYDRALKPLSTAAAGNNEYRFSMLGIVAAMADEQRAWEDLPRLLSDKHSLPVRRAALAGLGRVPKREAAQLALNALRVPELADHAAWAVIHQLQGDDDYRFGKHRGLGDDVWLFDAIRASLGNDGVPESAKRTIRGQLHHRLAPSEPLDLEAYRRNVLNPQDRTYHGWADGETAKMHRRATELCEPRVVPILVEALDTNPRAGAHNSYALPEVLCHYAAICPRLVRKEVEGRRLSARWAASPFHERNYKLREVMELVGLAAPEERSHSQEIEQCFDLAQEVRRGKPEQLEELFAITDRLFTKQQGYAALPALLECESPVARERLLAYINKAKKGRVSQWSRERYHGELTSILYALHPKYRQFHLELVQELLQSTSLSLRKAGVEALQSAWQSDFDFDPVNLEAERTRKLAEIEPVLAQIAFASEPQARVILLAQAGVAVIGEPNESWLPALVEAVGQQGNAAPHALRLVETIVGEERARKFQHFPPEQRKLALRAYLQDMGKLANQAQP
jgi:hypothetical protein